MDEKEWDRFFELLDKIVNDDTMGATWQEKAVRVENEAKSRDSATSLGEFAVWIEYIVYGG